MKRTLLAVGVAVLVCLLFVPYSVYRFSEWVPTRGTFWDANYDTIAVTPLILQTVFAAAVAAIIVNLFPRKPRK